MSGFVLGLALTVVLVGLTALFVAAEFALVKVPVERLEVLARKGSVRARATLAMIGRLDEFLNICQLGITVCTLLLGWVAEPLVVPRTAAWLAEPLRFLGVVSPELVHTISLVVVLGVLTLTSLLFGELVPKLVAIQRAEAVSLNVVQPMRLFRLLFMPALVIVRPAYVLILRALGFRWTGQPEQALSVEELRILVASAHARGTLGDAKRVLVERVLRFADRPVRQVMVPRVDIVWLRADAPIAESIERARVSGFTRLPLTEGNSLDQVLGYVNIKDLFLQPEPPTDLRAIRREIVFSPEHRTVAALLRELQRRQVHIAILLDEYGGTSGLVTLEDILEEIVGEIQDEFDREPPKVERRADGSIAVDGTMTLEELGAVTGVEIAHRGLDTLAGYLTEALGRLARPGDRVRVGSFDAEVTAVQRRRVRTVILHPKAAPQ